MWRHPILKAKKWQGQPFKYIQTKLDGWRLTCFTQPDGSLLVTSRRKEDVNYLDLYPRLRLLPEIRTIMGFPPRTSVDTEIIILPSAKNIARTDIPTALRDPSIPVQLVTFAFPFWNGTPAHQEDLEWAHDQAGIHDLPFAKYQPASDLFDTHPSGVYRTPKHLFKPDHQRLVELAMSLDLEGWMLKDTTQYGKWFKVKRYDTVDAIITGITPGVGMFENLVGSIQCSLITREGKLKHICDAGGMDFATRQQMTQMWNKDTLSGLVVEIRYEMVTRYGGLVSPRFIRFRPDKPANQCTIDQIIKEPQ